MPDSYRQMDGWGVFIVKNNLGQRIKQPYLGWLADMPLIYINRETAIKRSKEGSCVMGTVVKRVRITVVGGVQSVR